METELLIEGEYTCAKIVATDGAIQFKQATYGLAPEIIAELEGINDKSLYTLLEYSEMMEKEFLAVGNLGMALSFQVIKDKATAIMLHRVRNVLSKD